jgi:hypothetical protein
MHGRILVAIAGIAATSASFGHHSFAPHFDSTKPVRISGVITEFEARNPHAYVHIEAVDENGQTREYICESHGVTQLTRNGITPAMLAQGATITVTGSQARRDPYVCFFDNVELADGRVLNVNGPQRAPVEGTAASSSTSAARTDLYGKWMLVPANRATSGPQPMIESPRRRARPRSPRTIRSSTTLRSVATRSRYAAFGSLRERRSRSAAKATTSSCATNGWTFGVSSI